MIADRVIIRQKRYREKKSGCEFQVKERREGETEGNSRDRRHDCGSICKRLSKGKNEDEIYDKGFDDGYEEGKKDWQIWFYCAMCGKKLVMSPNDDDHKAMIRYMKEHGWGHNECH